MVLKMIKIIFISIVFLVNFKLHLISSEQTQIVDSIIRSKRQSTSCQCGRRNINNNGFGINLNVNANEKIVGGSLSQSNWPWMGAIFYLNNTRLEFFCGASLINDRYLLTAAHCLNDIKTTLDLSNLRILLGTNDLYQNQNSQNQNSTIVTIQNFVKHEKYNSQTLNADIALMKLSTPLNFFNSRTIRPICLSQKGSPFAGRDVIVTGWGSIKENGNSTNLLREAKIKVTRQDVCKRNYAKIKIIVNPNMMCAIKKKKDSCSGRASEGDSGGPLLVKSKNSQIFNQIGIVSFGKRCGKEMYPGVYTRVSKFMNWIRSNTRDAECKEY